MIMLGMNWACTSPSPTKTQSLKETIVGDWSVAESWLNGVTTDGSGEFWRFEPDGVAQYLDPGKGITSYGTYSLNSRGDSLVFGCELFETMHTRCMQNGDTLKLTVSTSQGVGRLTLISVNYTSEDSIQQYSGRDLVTFETVGMTRRKGTNVVDVETRVINSSPYSYKNLKFELKLYGDSNYFKALSKGQLAKYEFSIDILMAMSSAISVVSIQLPDFDVVAGPEYLIQERK